MLPVRLSVLTNTAYPVGRQDRHFYFRLFLLSRKASNAITRLPKAHNNVSMPKKIERISKAVIGATSLPMYSGKPVIGVGRLPPCHGYFPMAFAMLLIYHFSCHNSTIFVNSDGVNLLSESNRQTTPVSCLRFDNCLYYIRFFLFLQSPYMIF